MYLLEKIKPSCPKPISLRSPHCHRDSPPEFQVYDVLVLQIALVSSKFLSIICLSAGVCRARLVGIYSGAWSPGLGIIDV
jgi:hypothetical protein